MRHPLLFLLLSALICLPLALPIYGKNESSRVLDVVIHSPSLKDNLLGTPADRPVSVYLPPSYFLEEERRFPVLYFLHGNVSSTAKLDGQNWFGRPMMDLLDGLIADGQIREMIIVRPEGRHRYGGCQYANSPVSGNWADFITQELVAYVDQHFRSIPKPGSRGLAGSSMGGRGVLDIALKFPGVYGVVYAMFPGQMAFRQMPRENDAELWRELIESQDPHTEKRALQRLLGFAVAFSPNPNSPPYYADFPMRLVEDKMEYEQSVLKRWAAFDPVEEAAVSAESLRSLNALLFDCGDSDRGLEAARLFSSILDEQYIPHVFDEYIGGHGDRGAVRLSSRVLPAFSKLLEFD